MNKEEKDVVDKTSKFLLACAFFFAVWGFLCAVQLAYLLLVVL